ncbi:MAG: SemiSWEET family sugar transporter [Candidatus Woesearchaeota archaeon]
MSVLGVLATIFGMGMAIANFPQAIRIFRRKSAGDVSIVTYSLILAGSIVWVLYGIEISDTPLILANSVGITSVLTVMIGWFLYR